MRRITLTVMSTLAVLVLLFSYKTSRGAPLTAVSQVSGGAHVVSGGSASVAGSAPDPTTSAPSVVTVPSTAAGDPGSTTPAPTTRADPSTSKAAPSTTAPSTTAKASGPLVVDGAAADTQFGPVQVQVTIKGGKITDVTTPVFPQESGRDQEINSYAIPQLQQEALAAQGAQIDAVSGATYTSGGFITSLQSALDAAHFGQ